MDRRLVRLGMATGTSSWAKDWRRSSIEIEHGSKAFQALFSWSPVDEPAPRSASMLLLLCF